MYRTRRAKVRGTRAVNIRAVVSQKGGHKGGTIPKGWTQGQYFPKRVDTRAVLSQKGGHKDGGGHEGGRHKGGTFLKGWT